MFRNFVVGADGSKNSLAAADLAARLLQEVIDVRATVVHVTETPYTVGLAVPAHTAVFNEEKRLRDKAFHEVDALLDSYGVPHHDRHKSGSPAEHILEIADYEGADLVVVGHGDTGGLQRLLLGSVAQRVTAHARMAVLVGPPHARAPAPLVRSVLLATDGSPGALRATAIAADVAETTDANLVCVHASRFAGENEGYVDRLIETTLGRSGAVLDGRAVKHEDVFLGGSPAVTILDEAVRRETDLIILGHRAVAKIDRFLLGSVAAKVAARTSCAVLVAPPVTTA